MEELKNEIDREHEGTVNREKNEEGKLEYVKKGDEENLENVKNEEIKGKISFDIFSYLNKIYKKHGSYDEEISRFLSYVKKRRGKLKNKVLFKIKKVGKYMYRTYHTDIIDEKYLELLVLDVELCRCRYIQIKTDMNNLKIPYRAKFSYIRRLKKSLDKINFLNNIINNCVDKNTELQVRCYNTYIESSYLLEKKEYEKCLEKIDEFTKLIKLIKRITINSLIDNQKSEYITKEDDEKYLSNENNNIEKTLVKKSDMLLDEEKRIDEMYDYFLSVINSYERICTYNIKKVNIGNSNEKLQEDDFMENLNTISEHNSSITYNRLDIELSDDIIIINVKNVQFKLQENNNNILKIKSIIDDIKSVIEDEVIIGLNVDYNLRDISNNVESVFSFLNDYDVNFIINNYGNILSKYFDCLSIVHEELIKSTNENNKLSNDKLMDKIWNTLENYFLSEKIYIDIERTLLVLMKNLLHVYNSDDSRNFSFHNKKMFGDLIEAMPLLHEGIRYADILKQNTDELKSLEDNNIFINILQIIKNVKSLCLAFYYALTNKNAEAHVLFDLIKTRNYVYIKINNAEIHNKSLLRVAILFNRLQDLVSLMNEKYYFRHLSIYALQVKNKSIINKNLFYVDNSLFQPNMNHICLSPLHIDIVDMCRDSLSINQKEKSSGFRGLLRSFWKK
ncbi:signal recognition particle subunit SRP68, putative [Plasmodium relictum]|uniref:Signal recognition particle subunit SRP68 n=1 Tax=Plasmodium relictum TaxID=85471 RepID=A0A1J1H8P5_PLARL|nr:signal recognition particle subunit SRP68, putative [Plasmodium relictum]CRH00919.1 signal recognition particle subunit SRP68, putative [Plasmodium relictum]